MAPLSTLPTSAYLQTHAPVALLIAQRVFAVIKEFSRASRGIRATFKLPVRGKRLCLAVPLGTFSMLRFR